MDFSVYIDNFKKTGSFSPWLDDGGNIYLSTNSSVFNQCYVSVPIKLSTYDSASIELYYSSDFKEFIPTLQNTASVGIDDLNIQISQLQSTNNILQTQLNNIITLQESDSTAASLQANEKVIIGLRIALGQGHAESDFSTTFPYSPLT